MGNPSVPGALSSGQEARAEPNILAVGDLWKGHSLKCRPVVTRICEPQLEMTQDVDLSSFSVLN